MNKRRNPVDQYDSATYRRVISIAPAIASCAAICFTAARLLGLFPTVDLYAVVAFDVITLLYFFIAYLFRRKQKLITHIGIRNAQMVLVFFIALQWNLITYIFPFRDFWAYAPLFILIGAFFFDTWAVVTNMCAITVSMGISWFIYGDILLPAHDKMYVENLLLRIIMLAVTYIVILLLTVYSSRFKRTTLDYMRKLQDSNKAIHGLSDEIIYFTATLIDERDATSGAHVKRVQAYTKELALQYMKENPNCGLNYRLIDLISFASSLHDIGKIRISDTLLQKPGELNNDELAIMKTHTHLGAEIIQKLPEGIDKDFKKVAYDICLYHHERFDGNGYPFGLKGNATPLPAQIVAIVDCYDALTSSRPYKKAFTNEEALEMIGEGKCGVFSGPLFHSLMEVSKLDAWKEIQYLKK